jgi:hypothetical protein
MKLRRKDESGDDSRFRSKKRPGTVTALGFEEPAEGLTEL